MFEIGDRVHVRRAEHCLAGDELVGAVLGARREAAPHAERPQHLRHRAGEPSALNAIGLPTYAAVACSPCSATIARQRRAASPIASSHEASLHVPVGGPELRVIEPIGIGVDVDGREALVTREALGDRMVTRSGESFTNRPPSTWAINPHDGSQMRQNVRTCSTAESSVESSVESWSRGPRVPHARRLRESISPAGCRARARRRRDRPARGRRRGRPMPRASSVPVAVRRQRTPAPAAHAASRGVSPTIHTRSGVDAIDVRPRSASRASASRTSSVRSWVIGAVAAAFEIEVVVEAAGLELAA